MSRGIKIRRKKVGGRDCFEILIYIGTKKHYYKQRLESFCIDSVENPLSTEEEIIVALCERILEDK